MPGGLWGAGSRPLLPVVVAVAFSLLARGVPGAQSLGLYSPDDPLAQLDAETLERRLFNASGVWVVEFYASWCGHCKAFAPLWKGLARDVKGAHLKLWTVNNHINKAQYRKKMKFK